MRGQFQGDGRSLNRRHPGCRPLLDPARAGSLRAVDGSESGRELARSGAWQVKQGFVPKRSELAVVLFLRSALRVRRSSVEVVGAARNRRRHLRRSVAGADLPDDCAEVPGSRHPSRFAGNTPASRRRRAVRARSTRSWAASRISSASVRVLPRRRRLPGADPQQAGPRTGWRPSSFRASRRRTAKSPGATTATRRTARDTEDPGSPSPARLRHRMDDHPPDRSVRTGERSGKPALRGLPPSQPRLTGFFRGASSSPITCPLHRNHSTRRRTRAALSTLRRPPRSDGSIRGSAGVSASLRDALPNRAKFHPQSYPAAIGSWRGKLARDEAVK